MDRLSKRLANMTVEDLFSYAGDLSSDAVDDFKLLKKSVSQVSRSDLVAAREASPEVWSFLAALVSRRAMYRSQVASVSRALAADDGWRRTFELHIDPELRELLKFAFADQPACAKASYRLELRDQHPVGKAAPHHCDSEWQLLEDRVRRQDFAGANEDFAALRKSVLTSSSRDLDRQSEHAALVFRFLLGFASLRGKAVYRQQIIEVISVLMRVPSWRDAFFDGPELKGTASELHRDLKAAFQIQDSTDHDQIPGEMPAVHGPGDTSQQPSAVAGPANVLVQAEHDGTGVKSNTPSVGISDAAAVRINPEMEHDSAALPSVGSHAILQPEESAALPSVGSHAILQPEEGVPKAISRGRISNETVDNAAADLREFVESAEGQDLIWRVYECYNFIVQMAVFCRNRRRFGHGTTRVLAGATTAGGATAVIVGAALLATSGGSAAPVAGPLLYAGFVAGGVGAGVSLVSTLTALGWDAAEAKVVGKKIEELSSRIERWDHYMSAMLQAVAERTAGEAADSPHIAHDVALALAEYGAAGSSVYSIASASIRASMANSSAWSAAAPSAIGGAVKAGSIAATTLTISLSAASVVLGLVESINGGWQIWSGYCEAADSLDAHADKFCAILRMMKETARGTAVQRALKRKLPWLVLVQVDRCKLPKPDYRAFDHARKFVGRAMSKPPQKARVYFDFQMGSRIRKTCDLVQVTPNLECAIGQAILTRLLAKDEFQLYVQACDRRGVQSYLRGDPAMGSQLRLQIRWDEEHVVLHQPDCNTEMQVSYRLVRGESGLESFSEYVSSATRRKRYSR